MMTGAMGRIRRGGGVRVIARWGVVALLAALLSPPAMAQEDRTFGTTALVPAMEEMALVDLLSSETPVPEATMQLAADRLELLQTEGASLPTQNELIVLQYGAQNRAVIEQAGTGNLAIMYQDGVRITQSLNQQGDNNLFGSWIIGNDNTLDLVQMGNRNVYLFQFEGSGYDPGHTIEQIGDDNEVIQMGTGTPFSVEQYGSGMSMIITHQ